MSGNRALNAKEILRIIEADKAAREVEEWPGESNMELLAEAVINRRQSVEFIDGEIFTIRYSDQRKDVFISPSKPGKFQPCGYFDYDKLRAVIA